MNRERQVLDQIHAQIRNGGMQARDLVHQSVWIQRLREYLLCNREGDEDRIEFIRRAQHETDDVRMVLLDPPQNRRRVHLTHVQIGDNDIDRNPPSRLQGGVDPQRKYGFHLSAIFFQGLTMRIQNFLLVVDKEYVSHSYTQL